MEKIFLELLYLHSSAVLIPFFATQFWDFLGDTAEVVTNQTYEYYYCYFDAW